MNSVSIPNEVYAFTDTDGTGHLPLRGAHGAGEPVAGLLVDRAVHARGHPDRRHQLRQPRPRRRRATRSVPFRPARSNNRAGAARSGRARVLVVGVELGATRPRAARLLPRRASVCTVAKAGKPVPFYGSELLDQTALQWMPAYCLNKKRFNWQDNVMPDDAALALMQSGEAAAAEVSAPGRDTTAPVGYAPTAATGWAIAFDIDRPDNAGQQMSIKLNALLLAKLLTESYPGSTSVALSHPGFVHNPLSLNLDPDFYKLNPGLDLGHWSESAATLLVELHELAGHVPADRPTSPPTRRRWRSSTGSRSTTARTRCG